MKKLTIMFSFVLVALVVLLAGCSKDTDALAAYRSQPAATIFNNGEMALAKGKYSDATKEFEALDALYPFGVYTQQGQRDIIYAYYMDGDNLLAVAAADRYVRLYPQSNHVDYALYLQGLANFVQGGTWMQRFMGLDISPHDLSNLKAAFADFNQLVLRYPRSIYTKDAALHMAFIRNILARHELQIATFYMQRHVYVAAANRASYVVRHFQGAPQVIPALQLMVKAYTNLGLTQLAGQSAELLRVNYGKSA